MKSEVRELLSFIDGNPTAYHTKPQHPSGISC